MTPRDFAIDVVRRLRESGFEALWAGGCVRDELLGITPADYDVATNAKPDEVQKHFRRTIAIGAAFGVIDVVGPKYDGKYLNVQVATFRSDGTYTDGRRPDSVTFGTAEADAQRRDFTVNGLFFDPLDNRLIDYVGGQKDLEAKILRAIGNPIDRFTEDKLRVLRAVRMATRFDLVIDPDTLLAGKSIAPEIGAVSVERIAEELRKLLSHPRRARGVTLLNEFGLILPIFPELVGPINASAVAALSERAGFELSLASLLIPIGPKETRKVCLRLKLSNDELRRIVWLMEHREALIDSRRPVTRYASRLLRGLGRLVLRPARLLRVRDRLARLGRQLPALPDDRLQQRAGGVRHGRAAAPRRPARFRSEVREVLHQGGDLRLEFVVAMFSALAGHVEDVRRMFGHALSVA